VTTPTLPAAPAASTGPAASPAGRWRRWLRPDWPWPFIGAGLFGILLCWSDAWRAVELKTFDALTVLTAPGEAQLPITIVAVDEESMTTMGQQWPWPRGIHAQLLDRLKEAGVAVAAFDVVFSEPDRQAAEDEAFARAIKGFGRPVVLAANLTYLETRYARQWVRSDPRPAFLEAGANVGLASVKTDPDGVLRNIPVSQGAFWLAIVTAFDKVNPGIARNLSVSENDRIRYLGGPQTFATIPYYRLLDPEKLLSENWKDVLRDNIVFVGRVLKTAPELNAVESDMFFTPFHASTGQLTPGVEVQATIVANMMTGQTLREAPAVFPPMLVVAAALLAWLAMRAWHPWKSAAWTFALAALVALGVAGLFLLQRTWLPASASLVTLALAYAGQGARGFLSEQARRQQLRRAFSAYVSPAIVDEIIANPENLKLGGDRRDITLIFTDLAGFTSLSEKLPAEEVALILNRHLSEMTDIVIRHGGTVDKFIGDAVMAFWGAPIADPEQSAHALEAALEMQAATARLRAELLAKGGPVLRMRVGVHRGECIVGNMGGTNRFSYTAIGDAVNLASRLEGVNNVYGTGILASDSVAHTAGDGHPLRPVDTVRVKGRHQAVELFTPCDDPALAEKTAAALAAYRAGDWPLARASWQELAKAHPDDPIAPVFLARLEAWAKSGWPDPWDGVTVLESK
jgi:adenylate cyclase